MDYSYRKEEKEEEDMVHMSDAESVPLSALDDSCTLARSRLLHWSPHLLGCRAFHRLSEYGRLKRWCIVT
jgi:hypothetical protein